ncbi:terminase small subunit [Anaerovoracaceae bacterium 41-7]
MAKLTAKQQRFVEEYLIDLNATQAAIRAGYKRSEYTDTNANKLLENTRIKEEIDKAMAERSKRTGINQDRVVEELAKLAFVNAADVIDMETATVFPDAKPEDLACIQSVKVKTTTKGESLIEEHEIKLYDKKDSLVQLGKHLGMFKDKLELDADMELKITVDYGDTENEDS